MLNDIGNNTQWKQLMGYYVKMLIIGLSFFYNNYQTTINFQHHILNLNSPFLLAHGNIGNFDVTTGCEYANATQNYQQHL
jgi:hypothetical protein